MENKNMFMRMFFILFCLMISLSISSMIVKANVNDAVITNVYPNNQNANYNPRLSLNINDPHGVQLTVTFQTNKSGTWETIGTKTGHNGLYAQHTSGMDVKGARYSCRVIISDGTNSITRTYRFTAQAFVLKWSYNTSVATEVGPLAADVNGDGFYEVFATGEDKVTCVDGLTGKLLWEYVNADLFAHAPFEIQDLNNDNIPELIVAGQARTIALHANNGSVYWNSPYPGGHGGKFLVVVDTDGNKYPYVYIASDDVDHWTNGTGRIRKLRGTDGAMMAEVFAWRPCYGGLSAADANNDGKFEIYMGDRSVYYHPPSLGKGIQAYDADNLSILWYDDGITCSSHTPVIVDVNNDGVLDAVSMQQSGGGIYVIDGETGVKMPDKWAESLGLSGHSQLSVWDIDNDNSLELITCEFSNAKVWDIGNWKLDATLDVFRDPPQIADVIGDSNLEIAGLYNNVKIYDNSYQLDRKSTRLNASHGY